MCERTRRSMADAARLLDRADRAGWPYWWPYIGPRARGVLRVSQGESLGSAWNRRTSHALCHYRRGCIGTLIRKRSLGYAAAATWPSYHPVQDLISSRRLIWQ
jgi:hypothetical protein